MVTTLAHGTSEIAPLLCRFCRSTFQVRNSSPNIRTRTKQREMGIKYPTCGRCYIKQMAGQVPGTEPSGFGTLATSLGQLKSEMPHKLKKGGFEAARLMAPELESLWRAHGLLVLDVQRDMDRLQFETNKKRLTVGSMIFESRVRKLNKIHTRLIDCAQMLAVHINLTYHEDRKEADNILRKQWFRDAIMVAGNFRCTACGTSDRLQVDHVVPVIRNGPTEKKNLQLLCIKCNAAKGMN